MVELNLEQQFQIQAFNTQVDRMSLEQAKELLKTLHQQMITKEAMYKELLKHQWQIGYPIE